MTKTAADLALEMLALEYDDVAMELGRVRWDVTVYRNMLSITLQRLHESERELRVLTYGLKAHPVDRSDDR